MQAVLLYPRLLLFQLLNPYLLRFKIMNLTSILKHNRLADRRLQFMRAHQDAFDVEAAFPLPIFEEAMLEIEGACGFECSCKVEAGQLLAGRFEICNDVVKPWPGSLTHAVKLLDRIENRLGVRLNRDLFEQFVAVHLGSGKIDTNSIGIHLGSKQEDNSIIIYIYLNYDRDPEELVRTAIALDGGYYSDELRQVLMRDTMLIGFKLFFDGRSHVELCPCASAKPGKLGNRGKYLIPYIQKHFSAKVNYLFRVSSMVMTGFSKACVKPVYWFYFANIKDILKYVSFNSLGDRIYNFCQSQSCITLSAVAVAEQELEKNRLENFCFYYNQRDECQPHPSPDWDFS